MRSLSFTRNSLRVVNFNSLLGEGAEGREHGKFVNHFGDLRSRRNCAALERRVADGDVADQFAVAHLRRDATWMGAPMEIRKSRTRVRVGFRPTL